MVGLALQPYFDRVEGVLDVFADNASNLSQKENKSAWPSFIATSAQGRTEIKIRQREQKALTDP